MKLKEVGIKSAYCPCCGERTEWKYRCDQEGGVRTLTLYDCTICCDTLTLGSLLRVQREPLAILLHLIDEEAKRLETHKI